MCAPSSLHRSYLSCFNNCESIEPRRIAGARHRGKNPQSNKHQSNTHNNLANSACAMLKQYLRGKKHTTNTHSTYISPSPTETNWLAYSHRSFILYDPHHAHSLANIPKAIVSYNNYNRQLYIQHMAHSIAVRIVLDPILFPYPALYRYWAVFQITAMCLSTGCNGNQPVLPNHISVSSNRYIR